MDMTRVCPSEVIPEESYHSLVLHCLGRPVRRFRAHRSVRLSRMGDREVEGIEFVVARLLSRLTRCYSAGARPIGVGIQTSGIFRSAI